MGKVTTAAYTNNAGRYHPTHPANSTSPACGRKQEYPKKLTTFG